MNEPSDRKYQRREIRDRHELRAAAVDLASLASRALSIFTQDLEPDIYNHDDFLEAVKRLVLSRSFARVRVLINTPIRAIRSGHSLVAIGRRLSSHIEFRNVRTDLQQSPEAYMIADDLAWLYRPDASSWQGHCELYAPEPIKPRLQHFDELWQLCEPRTQAGSTLQV